MGKKLMSRRMNLTEQLVITFKEFEQIERNKVNEAEKEGVKI